MVPCHYARYNQNTQRISKYTKYVQNICSVQCLLQVQFRHEVRRWWLFNGEVAVRIQKECWTSKTAACFLGCSSPNIWDRDNKQIRLILMWTSFQIGKNSVFPRAASLMNNKSIRRTLPEYSWCFPPYAGFDALIRWSEVAHGVCSPAGIESEMHGLRIAHDCGRLLFLSPPQTRGLWVQIPLCGIQGTIS